MRLRLSPHSSPRSAYRGHARLPVGLSSSVGKERAAPPEEPARASTVDSSVEPVRPRLTMKNRRSASVRAVGCSESSISSGIG